MGLSKKKVDYANFLLTTRRDRELHGLPQSDQEYAVLKGMTDRTLRRWRNEDEEFQAFVDELRERLNTEGEPEGWVPLNELKVAEVPSDPRTLPRAEQRVTVPPPEADPEFDDRLSKDEQQYAKVKAEIARQAAGGDARALELYLKYWGQDHLERERQQQELLQGMSDERLVREVVELLGVELVASALADL